MLLAWSATSLKCSHMYAHFHTKTHVVLSFFYSFTRWLSCMAISINT